MAELVKAVTGASRVVVLNHTLRRRETGVADRTPGQARQPAGRVHVDQTVASGPQRVRDLMGEQAEDLLMRRAAIINVWRPIHHEARDWPLAFADARSVAKDDLIPSDLIFPHRKGEIYGVAYNPAQQWRFVPDLQVDEAILIKCWDSDASVAQFTPHTAFDRPDDAGRHAAPGKHRVQDNRFLRLAARCVPATSSAFLVHPSHHIAHHLGRRLIERLDDGADAVVGGGDIGLEFLCADKAVVGLTVERGAHQHDDGWDRRRTGGVARL